MHKLSQFSMKPISFLTSLLNQNDFLMVAFKESDISYLTKVLIQIFKINFTLLLALFTHVVVCVQSDVFQRRNKAWIDLISNK